MALDSVEQLEATINRLIEKHERMKKAHEAMENREQFGKIVLAIGD